MSQTSKLTLALATYDQQPGLYAEEHELIAHFKKRGVRAVPAIWNGPGVDWSSYSAVILRSTWDYFTHYPEFRAWLDRLDRLGVPLVNSSRLVRWNLDKVYLAELARAGVLTIPTVFVERDEKADLVWLLAEKGWTTRAILKPTISAGSFQTHRFDASDAGSLQPTLELITQSSGALIQPYLPQIETDGELSMLFFGGEPAFAVVKRAKPGDFRIQFTYGGTFERVPLDPKHVAAARGVLATLPELPTYARVDGVVIDGAFQLMEVELVEPYLYFAAAPEMADKFVDAVLASVQDFQQR